MDRKKFITAALSMAVIYFGISYLFSYFFKRDFEWGTRILVALAFGFIVTWIQIKAKRKKRR